jgi:hypothetical protein
MRSPMRLATRLGLYLASLLAIVQRLEARKLRLGPYLNSCLETPSQIPISLVLWWMIMRRVKVELPFGGLRR